MYNRLIKLPSFPSRSFFLWGPRQVGKTFLLRVAYPSAHRVDLLQSDTYARYLQRPALLREELLANKELPSLVVIDEVQKVPALLDEVHWMIEEKGLIFALCGSSARKLRRSSANMLGGRALRYELHGLVSAELGTDFDLKRVLNHGYLPLNYQEEDPLPGLRSYVSDYLKEEIAAEGLVRNLPAFGRFLEIAAICDTETVHYANVATDCGVSAPTVKEYFTILEDTMLGSYLPAYRKSVKRRIIAAPKFYLFDVGVVNLLSKRGEIRFGSPQAGHALENWLYHELRSHRVYSELFYDLSYWRLAQNVEVDFILNDMEIAIELKSADRVSSRHLKGLRELKREHKKVKKRYLVCNEPIRRITEDGIEIVPCGEFVADLWSGDLI